MTSESPLARGVRQRHAAGLRPGRRVGGGRVGGREEERLLLGEDAAHCSGVLDDGRLRVHPRVVREVDTHVDCEKS